MLPTDTDLVERTLIGNDRSAFGALVTRHQSAVRGFLRHLNRQDQASADDLAQETFLLAYKTLERFDRSTRFDTWLLGLAFNLHRNDARKRQKRSHFEVPEDLPTGEATPADLIAQRQDLREAMKQLSEEEQLVLHTCYTHDLSHPEAAQLLQMPLGTLKSHITRGKNKLREILSVWNPNP